MLAAGALRATVSPGQGGRIAAFWRETSAGRQDVLQPLQPGRFDPRAWPKAGCYPLVPYSNRIRGGRFAYAGRTVVLPAHPGTGDALHGFAQQRPWSLRPVSGTELAMVHEHAPDAWPWAFRATQRLRLDEDGLTVTLTVRNLSDEGMPVGLGLHPYFAAGPGDRIRFRTEWDWDIDPDFIATGRRRQPPAAALHDARLGSETVTEYLSGWSGEATLARRDGLCVRLAASPEFDHLVFHVPPGGAYACIEPVSHVADAFNLAAAGQEGTGLRVLPPGDEVTASLRIGVNQE